MTAPRPLGERTIAIRPPPSFPQLRWRNLRRDGHATSWRGLEDSSRIRLTHSGRAAIYQYCMHLRASGSATPRNVVLVPSFHCPTVVDPILHAGYEVRFYAIERTLNVVRDDFLRKLDQRVAAAVFIRYFGITEMDEELVAACRAAGAKVIEDSCHSFLRADPVGLASSQADAIVYSFWKMVPSLVGGGVLVRAPQEPMHWPQQHAPRLDDRWARGKELARQLLHSQIELADGLRASKAESIDEPLAPVVRKPAAEAYPYDRAAACWRMPLSTRWILESADLQRVIVERRRNYDVLQRALNFSSHLYPLRERLPTWACPWGFPVILAKRTERDYLIRARGVPVFTFGEVLHPLLFTLHAGEHSMLDDSRYLADSVLGLANHQDLREQDMVRYASLINEFTAAL